jgi:hypothetical protein
LVDRASQFLEKRFSRRSFINRSAFVGSAVALGGGLDLMLKPGTAYGQICSCAGQDCDCGSTCCAGYSEFCCTINGGYNYCPTGTIIGGWWKADNSSYCGGPRYYMDCNAQCSCGCGDGVSFCDPSCDGLNCGCGQGSCDNYVTGCFQFRYGQCNQDVGCIGRIACRVVACIPPWEVDPTCTTTNAEDDGTAEQDAPCWTSAPPSPPPNLADLAFLKLLEGSMPVSQAVPFAGEIHVLQVSANSLWHKALSSGWSNQNLFDTVGIGGITVPYQTPGVSVVGAQLVVTVEDSNADAWYFAMDEDGSWGVNVLP